MTDAPPPRRRIVTANRVIWIVLILCGAGAAYLYELGAFDRAARADFTRRSAYAGVHWPVDAYQPTLTKARDPRSAETAVPDEDSVSYFLHEGVYGPVLGQVFHVTLRQGLHRWRRQFTIIYDEYSAPQRLAASDTEPHGPPLTRQAALAWYDDWQARERAWRGENAHRLLALKVNLLLLDGTYEQESGWWHLQPESMDVYRRITASIYRFGDAGVEMLVDCLDDAGPTTTRYVVDGVPGAPVPAGTVCFHILKDLVMFEDSPQDSESVMVNGEPVEWLGDLTVPADAPRLAAGEAAWRARMKRGNYHFVRPIED